MKLRAEKPENGSHCATLVRKIVRISASSSIAAKYTGGLVRNAGHKFMLKPGPEMDDSMIVVSQDINNIILLAVFYVILKPFKCLFNTIFFYINS